MKAVVRLLAGARLFGIRRPGIQTRVAVVPVSA